MLLQELLDRQRAALLGFDVVLAKADESSGLKRPQQLAREELKDQPAFTEKRNQLQADLDHDAVFVKSIE